VPRESQRKNPAREYSARASSGSDDDQVGLALLLYTVKRRGDVVRMRRRHVRGGMDAVRPIPSGVRVSIATGHTDMRRGMQGLALTVQESLKRDPHAGDLYIFRGRRGDLAKILWHDGISLSLYAKRLDRGKFICPRRRRARCRSQRRRWLICCMLR
jgi:transposase